MDYSVQLPPASVDFEDRVRQRVRIAHVQRQGDQAAPLQRGVALLLLFRVLVFLGNLLGPRLRSKRDNPMSVPLKRCTWWHKPTLTVITLTFLSELKQVFKALALRSLAKTKNSSSRSFSVC